MLFNYSSSYFTQLLNSSLMESEEICEGLCLQAGVITQSTAKLISLFVSALHLFYGEWSMIGVWSGVCICYWFLLSVHGAGKNKSSSPIYCLHGKYSFVCRVIPVLCVLIKLLNAVNWPQCENSTTYSSSCGVKTFVWGRRGEKKWPYRHEKNDHSTYPWGCKFIHCLSCSEY